MKSWLTLKDAAALLDVHTSTLRRWADKGEIPVLVTPGGHRRFSPEDIEQFRDRRHGRRSGQPLEKAWSENAINRTRKELTAASGPSWMSRISEEGRIAHRQLGRQLMGLTLQYLANGEEASHYLEEARLIGEEYGRLNLAQGLPLNQALEAMLFFRDTLMEVALELPKGMKVRPDTTVNMVRRINLLLNEVHLAVARVYQQTV